MGICNDNDAIFAKIDSQQVSDHVTNALNAFSEETGQKDKCAWLGANDNDKEGSWRWHDGTWLLDKTGPWMNTSTYLIDVLCHSQ